MDRTDLLNALRLVRDCCGSRGTCEGCLIKDECDSCLDYCKWPCHWDLDDDV